MTWGVSFVLGHPGKKVISLALLATVLCACGDAFVEPVEESEFGTLLACDVVEEHPFFSEDDREWVDTFQMEYISTTPGEVLEFTFCDGYYFENGVELESKPGCHETREATADDDVYEQACSLASLATAGPDKGDLYETGWGRVYLRRK